MRFHLCPLGLLPPPRQSCDPLGASGQGGEFVTPQERQGPLSLGPSLSPTSLPSLTHLPEGVPEAQQEEYVLLQVLGKWLAEGLAQHGVH